MGCPTIARYLERLPDDVVVGGAVFVAGFFKSLTGLSDDADAQEKIVRMQIGMEMLEANRIGPIEYYEKWVGSDDPYGDFQSALAWQVQRALLDTVMIPRILQRVMAGLRALTPNEALGRAEGLVAATNPRPDMLPGEPAAAAGIRQPGVEQGAVQNQLPTLAGPGADSVQDGLPAP